MKLYLLPFHFKFAGAILVCLGTVLGVLYFLTDFRVFMNVFAIFTWFAEARFFVIFKTNIADELIMLSLLSGFLLISFSRERAELNCYRSLRCKAFFRALAVKSLLLFISVLFVFGTGFILVLVLNLFSIFIFYEGFFYYFKQKYLQQQSRVKPIKAA